MTDDERLTRLLRAALPPVTGGTPSRDLWSTLVARDHAPMWSWTDVAIATLVASVLLMIPDWFWFLAYHL